MTGERDTSKQVDAAVDRLADVIELGHLLTATGGSALLLEAADEIERLRARAETVASLLDSMHSAVHLSCSLAITAKLDLHISRIRAALEGESVDKRAEAADRIDLSEARNESGVLAAGMVYLCAAVEHDLGEEFAKVEALARAIVAREASS